MVLVFSPEKVETAAVYSSFIRNQNVRLLLLGRNTHTVS